jgi:two-component sensor histidine kinase/ABC-type amino acid transport substrate-binding protein
MIKSRQLHFILLYFSGIFLFLASLTASADDLTPDQRNYLKEKQTIVFISQKAYPPFEFIDKDGEHTGMSIELARWIATEYGFKAKFEFTDFKEAQEAVLAGTADILTTLFYSEKRDASFDFTEVIFDVPASIFVIAERPDIRSIRDLGGKTIAIQRGDYALEFLKEQKISFQAAEAADFGEATDLVIAGRADAIIGDEQIVFYHLYSNGLISRIKKVGEPLYIGKNCMAATQGNEPLIQILNQGIQSAREKGVLNLMHRKWLGVQYSPQTSFLERYRFIILPVPGALLLIVVWSWFWNLHLRKEMARRTKALVQSERTRRASEERMMAALAAIDEGFVIYDADDRLVMSNSKYLEIYKESADLLVPGAKFEEIMRQGIARGLYSEAMGREEDFVSERLERHRKAEGTIEQQLGNGRWVKISERKTQSGDIVGFRVDITDIKNAEARILSALKEKETMLREIHHRVKNNMQVVQSLLSLQASKFDDPEVFSALVEAQSKIQSMALVHEFLYHSESLTDIDLQCYFEKLTLHLCHVFAQPIHEINVEVHAEGTHVDIDQAVPCGLIVTELVSNALKYAFSAGSDGRIWISATQGENHDMEMMVADNGMGLDKAVDPGTVQTLGMRLVTELVEDQLEGTWSVERNGGTRWVIRWPLAAEKRT